MDGHPRTTVRSMSRRTFLGGAAVFGAASLIAPPPLFAEPTSADKRAQADAVRVQVTDMQNQLAKASEEYHAALSAHDEAAAAVDAAQTRIDEITAEIEVIQDELGTRVAGMYRRGEGSFIDLLFGASTFEELVTGWDFINRFNERDAALVQQVKDLRAEAEEQKAILAREEETAAQTEAEALRVKEEAQATTIELQALLDTLDAEARELLRQEQAAAREAALAAEEAAALAKKTGGIWSYPFSEGTGEDVESYPDTADSTMRWLGYPYHWGEEGLRENVPYIAFDCSGLVRWAFLREGISVPHQTEAMFWAAKWRGPVSAARKGDILWMSRGDGYNGHAGIALCDGGTRYIHAPVAGDVVRDDYPLSWAGFTHTLRF